MKQNESLEKNLAWRKAHYEQKDVNGRLVINLRNILHTMRDMGRGSQKRILTVLLKTGSITQRELTEWLGIQPGSASEVIAKLENAGLLTRTESKADRRTVDVSLTEEGKRQAEEAKAQQTKRYSEMFSALSDEEKRMLLKLLEKVNADWESRYADRQAHHHGHHEHHGHHGPHSDWEGHGRPRCSHDCANCHDPCPKGQI